jgi:anti-sigma factor RsiW
VTEPERPVGTMTCDDARDLAAGYVLGALEHDEETAVRAHLATCDQAHVEFAALGGVVPALLELDPSELVEPPPSLGPRIMAAAAADLAARGERPKPNIVAFSTARGREDPRAATPRGAVPSIAPRRLDWALRIAAVIAILAVGAWGINLQGQLDRARAFDQAVAAVVRAATEPGARTAILAAQAGYQSSGIAAVAADGSVVMAMHDLPATSGSQVYTAWVIVGSSAPVPVGDFAASGGSSAFTTRPTTTPVGATIALTLEPNAGNSAPKGPIVSAGVTTSPAGANG